MRDLSWETLDIWAILNIVIFLANLHGVYTLIMVRRPDECGLQDTELMRADDPRRLTYTFAQDSRALLRTLYGSALDIP